ncbi:cupin domain-containing protein [Halomonas sp. LR5S13]|uniref:cupin domain-containing protein n=1 Tax=Halomonas rhizosphaerae TaxID=3043296 RepID=UPI0024A91242|nr:cupin domain-containing protein [Halomonas rhizosphaerae]MDI5921394.1 cupin domain-containing protein [Halomonas rhizosphaerae]
MNHKTLTQTLSATALGLALAVAAQAAPYQGDGHLIGSADELEWGPVASMGEGAEIAIIEGDLSKEAPFTIRLRLEDGYEIQPHVHPAYERVTVLDGTLHFAHGERYDSDATQALAPGDFAIMSPGDPMFGYAEGETLFQLHGTGPWGIEYLDPAQDPRN